MAKDDRGQSSEKNKNEGTGTPADRYTEDLQKDKKLTERYTDGGDGLAEDVRTNNPNRNVDKEDATNAGGYKN